jgi:hypothetical protein
MKKLITIMAAVAVVSIAAQGQGFVNFANSSAAGSKISTNGIAGGAALGLAAGPVNSFYFALFVSTTATNVAGSGTGAVVPPAQGTGSGYVWSDSNWSFSGAYATNAASAGRVSGNTSSTGTGAVVTGVAGGGFAQFVVVAWSANLGSTLSALQTSLANMSSVVGVSFLGESAVSGSVQVGDGVSVANPTILAASGAVPGFTVGELAATPEPGTLALAALGGASLLMFRRKNK